MSNSIIETEIKSKKMEKIGPHASQIKFNFCALQKDKDLEIMRRILKLISEDNINVFR